VLGHQVNAKTYSFETHTIAFDLHFWQLLLLGWGANCPLHGSNFKFVHAANHLGGEPSWWQNILVAKRPGGESSKVKTTRTGGKTSRGQTVSV